MYRARLPQLRQLPGAGLGSHRRRRRAVRQPRGRPLVRAAQDERQLGDPEPGHVRPARRALPLDGLRPRWTRTGTSASATRSATGPRRTTRASRTPGRLASDPPNTARPGRGDACTPAPAPRPGTSSRWGDYSMMTTDPVDDCTFWYTTEYLQTTGRTRGGPASGASSSRPAARRRLRHLQPRAAPPPSRTSPPPRRHVTASRHGPTVCRAESAATAHTVTSDTGAFGSDMLNPGDIFTYTLRRTASTRTTAAVHPS